MSWGMDIYDRESRNQMQFDWSEAFRDPAVRGFWVDFFWNNALIDRVELCHIDGGHGTIPFPTHDKTISAYETAVALLVHGLASGDDYDGPLRYLDQLGIEQQRDKQRWGAGGPAD